MHQATIMRHGNTAQSPTRKSFRDAVKNALSKGRGKGRNIFITGPANCGKTFMLKLLCDTFDAFVNPASGTFAWVGVEEAEIIILNDFRWSEQILPWQDICFVYLKETKFTYQRPRRISRKILF